MIFPHSDIKIKRLGIIIEDLGPSQLAYYLIKNTNDYLATNYLSDLICFYENISRPIIDTRFATMNMHEIHSYYAPVISTTLNNTRQLLGFLGPASKYFYDYYLGWTIYKHKNYDDLEKIYRNPSIKILARCDKHAQLIENSWNISIYNIVEDCNISKLFEICHNTN